MIINVSTDSGIQRVTFSNGTYLEFQVVGREIVVNSTNNNYIANICASGYTFYIDLSGDTIQIGNDILKFSV